MDERKKIDGSPCSALPQRSTSRKAHFLPAGKSCEMRTGDMNNVPMILGYPKRGRKDDIIKLQEYRCQFHSIQSKRQTNIFLFYKHFKYFAKQWHRILFLLHRWHFISFTSDDPKITFDEVNKLVAISTLRPRLNDRQFCRQKCLHHFCVRKIWIWLKFHWYVF